jgi:hypothetical protein
MLDLLTTSTVRKAKSSAQITATGAGDIIDVKGYRQALFIVLAAAVTTADGSNFFTFSLDEDDDAEMDAGTQGTPAGHDMLVQKSGGVPGDAVVLNATGQANTVIGTLLYKGSKRYARLKWTETGTADAVVGAVVVLSDALRYPAASA